MNRELASTLAKDMLEALKPLEAKHNITFIRRSGRFTTTSPGTYTLKIEAAEKTTTGVMVDYARLDYESMCQSFGLKREWLDREFVHEGYSYRITGLSPRKRKYPVLALRVVDNRRYKFGTGRVRRAFEKQVSMQGVG